MKREFIPVITTEKFEYTGNGDKIKFKTKFKPFFVIAFAKTTITGLGNNFYFIIYEDFEVKEQVDNGASQEFSNNTDVVFNEHDITVQNDLCVADIDYVMIVFEQTIIETFTKVSS